MYKRQENSEKNDGSKDFSTFSTPKIVAEPSTEKEKKRKKLDIKQRETEESLKNRYLDSIEKLLPRDLAVLHRPDYFPDDKKKDRRYNKCVKRAKNDLDLLSFLLEDLPLAPRLPRRLVPGLVLGQGADGDGAHSELPAGGQRRLQHLSAFVHVLGSVGEIGALPGLHGEFALRVGDQVAATTAAAALDVGPDRLQECDVGEAQQLVLERHVQPARALQPDALRADGAIELPRPGQRPAHALAAAQQGPVLRHAPLDLGAHLAVGRRVIPGPEEAGDVG